MEVYSAPRGVGPYGISTTAGAVYFASLAGGYIGLIDLQTGNPKSLIHLRLPRERAAYGLTLTGVSGLANGTQESWAFTIRLQSHGTNGGCLERIHSHTLCSSMTKRWYG